MPQFPIWLPALLGTANLLLAVASLFMVRQSRRYFVLADESRRAAQAALAEVMAITGESAPVPERPAHPDP